MKKNKNSNEKRSKIIAIQQSLYLPSKHHRTVLIRKVSITQNHERMGTRGTHVYNTPSTSLCPKKKRIVGFTPHLLSNHMPFTPLSYFSSTHQIKLCPPWWSIFHLTIIFLKHGQHHPFHATLNHFFFAILLIKNLIVGRFLGKRMIN